MRISDWSSDVCSSDLILGYGVLSVAADESHVLNICIDPQLQGQGLGRRLLRALLKLAGGHGARRVFLEVRPSNPHAIALYHDEGFNEIGRRPRYYPAHVGREDAIVMAKELLDPSVGAKPPTDRTSVVQGKTRSVSVQS